jgi:molybdate transport system ATP-binding protein
MSVPPPARADAPATDLAGRPTSPAPRWDVSVQKALESGGHRFELDVAFRSDAARLVLFGPSGAGKSLTLRAIAGLLRPDGGAIAVDGEQLLDVPSGTDVPCRERRLGYLFQEYALFPHLTVRQNVSFGLRRGWRNPRRGETLAEADRWLDTLDIRPLADRYPDQLSGGQRQRTALARALAGEPRALLLDEPFAALDASLRVRLRDELRELQARLGVPILLITHDEADVAAFADDVVRIEDGRVLARREPGGRDTAMKTSARNHLTGRVSGVTAGAIHDEVELTLHAGQRLVAVVTHESAANLGLTPGAEAFALVKASSVLLATDLGGARLSARNQLRGTVARIQPGAVNAEVLIDVGGGQTMAAIVTQESVRSLGLEPGAAVLALFKASSVVVGVPG